MIWLRLFGILGWLKRAVSACFAWARANPQLATIALLAAFCAFLWHRDSTHVRQRDEARAEIVAMKAAMNKALAASKKLEQAGKELANAVDNQHSRSLADAMDASSRYISSHRLRTACPVRASAPTEGDGARSDNRPDPAPELVAVSADDIRICTVNTTRLESARDWATKLEDLQDNGLPGIY